MGFRRDALHDPATARDRLVHKNTAMSSDDILTLAPPPADERMSYGSDPLQFGDLRLPKQKGPHPVVMNIHGGFWRNKYDLAHAGHLCAALTARGVATWNIEYRRVGDKGGGWPGTLQDVVNGYRYIARLCAKYGLDAKRVLVMGHSAGGHLALCLAADHNSVKHVISLAGVTDLQKAWDLHLSNDAVAEFLGGLPSRVPVHYQQADPSRLAISAEQWLIHGTDDDVVPVEFSRAYAKTKQAKGERVHLSEIPKAGHFDVIDPHSAAWSTVEEVVLKLVAT
jgi:acetyl esterase/lipase